MLRYAERLPDIGYTLRFRAYVKHACNNTSNPGGSCGGQHNTISMEKLPREVVAIYCVYPIINFFYICKYVNLLYFKL